MRRLGLVNVRVEAVPVEAWVRGEERVELVGVGPLQATALGRSGATQADGVEAEVVRVVSVAEAQAMGADKIQGKILFIDGQTARTKDGSGYGQGVEPRRLGGAVGERLGAVGVVIRSVSTGNDNQPHTGSSQPSKIPAFALGPQDATKLAQRLAAGQARLKLVSRSSVRSAESANVIGEVVGSTAPQEIVLLGAHLDAWDLGQGAIDDASGVGVVLDVAKRMLTQAPARTIRVVLFANEENGLSGARAYAAAHAAEIDNHVLALESDSGDGEVYGVLYNASPSSHVSFQRWLAPLLARGVQLEAKAVDGGADLIPLAMAGVPVVEFAQDRSRYFDFHHSALDRSEALELTGLRRLADDIFALVSGAGSSTERFGKAQKPEF
jgi:carboxypeptidase Q